MAVLSVTHNFYSFSPSGVPSVYFFSLPNLCLGYILLFLIIFILVYLYFSHLIAVLKAYKIILNKSGKSEHLCIVPMLRGNTS